MTKLGRRASAQDEGGPQLSHRGSLKSFKLGRLAFVPSALYEEVEEKDPCHPQRQPKFDKISVIFYLIFSIQQYFDFGTDPPPFGLFLQFVTFFVWIGPLSQNN